MGVKTELGPGQAVLPKVGVYIWMQWSQRKQNNNQQKQRPVPSLTSQAFEWWTKWLNKSIVLKPSGYKTVYR